MRSTCLLDLIGVDGKNKQQQISIKETLMILHKMRKTVIQYLNDIDNNLSGDEAILVKVSNSISEKISTLLTQVRVIRKGTTTADDPNSAEAAGTKVTKDRDGKAKSDEDFKNASTAEKLEWVKKNLVEGNVDNPEEESEKFVGKDLRFSFTDVDCLHNFYLILN